MAVVLSMTSMVVETDTNGIASFELTIPGNAGEIRILKGATIWSNNWQEGDFVYDFKIKTPAGQVVQDFSGDITETQTLRKGFFVPPGEVVKFDNFEGGFKEIPSGLILRGAFKSGSGLPGKKVYCNFHLGKTIV